MAEMANTLAFQAYEQTASNYDHDKSSPRDRDSGVFMSDDEHNTTPSRSTSVSLKNTPTTHADKPTPRRLQRPAELNLGQHKKDVKPKSELEMRYDLIRNSSTKNKAALKSPTALLEERLNLNPKKKEHEEKERVFMPPKPIVNGCIMPSIGSRDVPFQAGDVRAKTEKGRPSWWCKFDKLVVFDGIEMLENGGKKFLTRSSKGLSIARRRGDLETVVVPLDCQHCRDMLHREEWKYDIRVCKRSVCWDCRERCRWEEDQQQEGEAESEEKSDANRERADSVMRDEVQDDQQLMEKIGIDARPRSPIEAVGGIEERLEKTP